MKNLVVIGNGRVTAHYKKILKRFFDASEYKIDALIELDEQKLADRFFSKCRRFNRLDEFLKTDTSQIKYGLICTPSGTHYEITKSLLLAGIVPIVEKPPTLTLDQLDSLKKIELLTGLKSAYIFQNRFNPAVVEAKRLLDSGYLGKLITVSVVLRWCRFNEYFQDEWHGTWENDGGVSAQQGIHHLDALQYLAGEVDQVMSYSATLINKLEAEDTWKLRYLFFFFKNGSR